MPNKLLDLLNFNWEKLPQKYLWLWYKHAWIKAVDMEFVPRCEFLIRYLCKKNTGEIIKINHAGGPMTHTAGVCNRTTVLADKCINYYATEVPMFKQLYIINQTKWTFSYSTGRSEAVISDHSSSKLSAIWCDDGFGVALLFIGRMFKLSICNHPCPLLHVLSYIFPQNVNWYPPVLFMHRIHFICLLLTVMCVIL